MTVLDVANWLPEAFPELSGKVSAGSMPGNAPEWVGVYSSKSAPEERICLGGATSSYGVLKVDILVHWTQRQAEAQEMADRVYSGLQFPGEISIGGEQVIQISPGGGPIWAGKDGRGVFEYLIPADIYYRKD